ncbi:MAG: phage integrase N-terminal SAM-like domain-containing protein [Immundisolibacter sp.]|nr:phage integrase N-terminal SAM-like domain-containing protein [Immundisolibacter sp.]
MKPPPKTCGDHTSGGAPEPKLLDKVRARIRRLHYTVRTQDAYVDCVRRFVLFHGSGHPRGLGAARIETFLRHLAGL